MRLEGELTPKRDDAGVWHYDPADVVRLLTKRGVNRPLAAGETAALAFQMFEHGVGLREVVVSLQLTPEAVRALYRD